MADLSGVERGRYVQEMFANIAHRYDLMNRVMTFGQDARWRREVIRRASVPNSGKLLDLGAGTGDLALEALIQHPDAHVVAADFTLEMMRTGRGRPKLKGLYKADLDWTSADAQSLPYPGHTFDAVVSGFLLRNVSDLDQCLSEQRRVLKPGGWIVALDTSPPPKSPLTPFLRFQLHTVIPALGEILTGQREAYTYLPDSTEGFLEPERLAARFCSAGFVQVGFRRVMFGTVAIHWGLKPGTEE
jgi:demethylmenaquinone methyltransferase/2-methoxy-6-polyprenyl-1,4-benzoquinol methylase